MHARIHVYNVCTFIFMHIQTKHTKPHMHIQITQTHAHKNHTNTCDQCYSDQYYSGQCYTGCLHFSRIVLVPILACLDLEPSSSFFFQTLLWCKIDSITLLSLITLTAVAHYSHYPTTFPKVMTQCSTHGLPAIRPRMVKAPPHVSGICVSRPSAILWWYTPSL